MKVASDFRTSARKALKGKWTEAVVAGLIASMLGGVSSSGVSFNFSSGSDTGISETFENIDTEALIAALSIIIIVFAVILVIAVAFYIIGSLVSPGYAKYNLDLIDGKHTELGSLFKYFKHWKSVIPANLLKSVYIFLWTLLFIIPGVIASYNYAMVPYILAEEPTLSAREALEKSKTMMYGNRWRLFCLQMSFIGWAFLCVFACCGLGSLWLTPYEQASFAAFYREISGTGAENDNDNDVEVIVIDNETQD